MAVLIIFSVILQTVVNLIMLFIVGQLYLSYALDVKNSTAVNMTVFILFSFTTKRLIQH